MKQPPRAPQARQNPTTDAYHGIDRTDEYAWLRDENWQAVMRDPALLDAEIRTHLEAENAYTDAVLAPHAALRETLVKEMKGRMAEDEASLARNNGNAGWLSRYVPGGEHPLICMGPRDCTSETAITIIDGNQEAQGHDYFKIGATEIAPSGDMLAWAADVNGSEYFTIKIRDTATRQDLDDHIVDTGASMGWSACGQYLFYVALDENHRPNRVMRHALGTQQSQDICVYQEVDSGFFVGLSATRSGRFLVISAHDHETAESWLIPTDTPDAAPRCVAPREIGHEYEVDDDAARDRLIILTNWDPTETDARAMDFRICACPLENVGDGRDAWQPLVAHQRGCLILDAIPYRDHLVYTARRDALPFIAVQRVGDTAPCEIAFDEAAYDLSLDTGLEYDTNIVRFDYASMTTPRQTFDYDMQTGARALRKTQTIPSGHDPADYVTRRIMAPSHDGAQVPVSLVYHRDTKLDGSAPCLLYGYGAYGITIPASFSFTRLSLVDRGFVYAIAHIRGGKARGHDWFLAGRGTKKTNSFEDFAAAARALIAAGYTQKGNITIHGGSAGGLLVGATVNLAPDLFRGAVAEVPFVDVLTTMLDASLPLTPPEWPEWGNPIADAEAYRTIAAYAPYENITARAYPQILATAGLTDPRVTYWEPAKWVARLRARRTDDGLTLLRTEMSAGHGGKAGRYNQFDELAMVYSFVLAIHNSKKI